MHGPSWIQLRLVDAIDVEKGNVKGPFLGTIFWGTFDADQC